MHPALKGLIGRMVLQIGRDFGAATAVSRFPPFLIFRAVGFHPFLRLLQNPNKIAKVIPMGGLTTHDKMGAMKLKCRVRIEECGMDSPQTSAKVLTM